MDPRCQRPAAGARLGAARARNAQAGAGRLPGHPMIPLSQHQDFGVTFAEPSETQTFSERLHSLASPGVAGAAVTAVGLVGAPHLLAGQISSEIAGNPTLYGNLFRAAERQTMLVDTLTSKNIASEEAYDRRIKAVKDATGVTLENPLPGGYADEIKRANRQDIIARAQLAEQDVAEPLTGKMIFGRKLDEV